MAAPTTIQRIGCGSSTARQTREDRAYHGRLALLNWDATNRVHSGYLAMTFCPALGRRIYAMTCEERQACMHLVPILAEQCGNCEKRGRG